MKLRLLSSARLSFPLATAIAALLAAPVARATNYYWDIDGTTAGAGGATPGGAWSSAGTAFWSTDVNGAVATPSVTTATTDDLFFSAGTNATGAYSVTVSGTVQTKSLTFEDGTATISGATGNILNMGGTGNITVNSGAGATINIGGVTGSAGLTKQGLGTLTLNMFNASAFTGGVNINGGILQIAHGSGSGTAATGMMINSANALTLGGGTLLFKPLAGTIAFKQDFAGITINAGGGQILGDKNGATSVTFNLGALTATAAGGSLLVGANGTAANAPIITTTTNKDATGTYGGRVVFYNGTANTGYDWATTVTVASPFTLSGLVTGSYSTMVVGATSDALNTRVAGAGITLTGAHTHNSLKLEGSSGTLALGANLLTLTNGGLLVTGTTATAISGTAGATRLTGSASGDLIIHQFNSGGLTISAVIGDNGGATALTKAGSQTLTLSGINTYSGSTYLNSGTLVANATTSLPGFNSADKVVFTGGTLQVPIAASGAWTMTDVGTLITNATKTSGVLAIDTTSGNQTQAAAYNLGAVGLSKVGTNTLTLDQANTINGATSIAGGTLRLANTAAVQNSSGVTFSASNTTLQLGTDTVFSSFPVLSGGFSSTSNLTIVSDRATAGAGLTHALGTGILGNAVFNFTKGSNVTSGTAGISFTNILMQGGSTGIITLNPTTANLTITGNATGNNTGTGTLTLDGTSTGNSIAGAIGNGTRTTQNLIKSNTGTWTLSGASTYNGTTTINAGTLQYTGSGGSSGGGAITIDATTSGVTAQLTLNTSGEVKASAVNYGSSHSGAEIVTLTSGTLTVGTTGISVGTAGSGGCQLNFNGGTLKSSGAFAITSGITTKINSATAVVDTTGGSITANAAFLAGTGTGNLTVQGGNTLTLNGLNTYTGLSTISAGTLKLGNANAVQNSTVSIGVTNGLTFAGSIGTFNLGGMSGASDESLMDANAQGVTISVGANNVDTTYSGNLSDVGAATNGALTKVGTGTLTLSGTASYWGATIITNGTLRLTGLITGGGDPYNISTSGTGIFNESAAGVISGAASFTQGSSGTSFLSGVNSYTGATTISAGALSINNIANKSSACALGAPTTNATARIIMGGTGANTGTLIYTGALVSTDRQIIIGSSGANTGGATIQNDGSGQLTFSNAVFNFPLSGSSANRTLTLQGSNGGIISGVIANNVASTALVALTKAGNGTWTLAGANTYTGATTLSGGILSVGASNNLGGSASNLVFNGGTLQITGTALTDLATIGHTVSFNAGTVVGFDIADPDNTFTVDQVLNQATGGVTKLGSGTMVLSQVNTYTGATTINAGTLQITGAGSLNSGSYNGAVSIATGATFQYGSSSAQILSGIISGAGGLTKDTDSASVLTLAGANTYTGETAINSGTLKLDYSIQNNSKLSDTADLVLGGGTLDLGGGSHTEIVASTTLIDGTASHITSSVPGSVLQMGVISRGIGATIDFGATGIATTDTPNNDYGILGTWATTVDGFAVNSTNGDGGAITTGPTSDVARRNGGAQVIADNSTTNVRIIEGTGSAAGINLAAATTTINTLAQTASGGTSDATINSGGQTLLTNAILVATGAGALNIGNGTLATATPGGDLALVNNTASGFTIHSVIANNTSASTLTKTGVGVATLAGVNTYTGASILSDGTLSVGTTANLGAPAANLVFDGGTLQITGTALTNFSGIGHTVSFNLDMNVGLDIANAAHIFMVDQVLDQGIGAFYKYGPGIVILNQVNTFTANFNNYSDVIEGTLLATRFASLPGVADDGWFTETGATLAVRAGGSGEWTSANLDTLLGDGGNTWAFGTGSKLGIEVTAANTFTYANDMAGTSYEPEISATKGLVKLGTGTLTLSGINTYTGATTVTAGTLALVGGSQASLITVNNLASLGFTLGFGTTSTSTVSFSTGSTVKITGTPAPATSYTLMTASSFAGITPALDTPITGFQLQVDGGNTLKLVPVAGGYASWKATNALTGTPGDDYDGDGVTNAVEYVLGGTALTNDLSKLPAISTSGGNLVFTFKRDQASIDGTTSIAIQVGTTLTTWPVSYNVGANTSGSDSGVTVAKDTPSAGTDTVTLTVTQAPDPAKFARLVVTPTP